jgi:hypothetical protein
VRRHDETGVVGERNGRLELEQLGEVDDGDQTAGDRMRDPAVARAARHLESLPVLEPCVAAGTEVCGEGLRLADGVEVGEPHGTERAAGGGPELPERVRREVAEQARLEGPALLDLAGRRDLDLERGESHARSTSREARQGLPGPWNSSPP